MQLLGCFLNMFLREFHGIEIFFWFSLQSDMHFLTGKKHLSQVTVKYVTVSGVTGKPASKNKLQNSVILLVFEILEL